MVVISQSSTTGGCGHTLMAYNATIKLITSLIVMNEIPAYSCAIGYSYLSM